MADNVAIAIVGGLFSVIVAAISGLLATRDANKKARSNLLMEIDKIEKQMEVQQGAQTSATLLALSQKYLTPLRYHGKALAENLGVLGAKLESVSSATEARGWFKVIKDEVTQDDVREDYQAWCYYEGIFAGGTIYYTCSYLYCARELQFGRPFAQLQPRYSDDLDALLTKVTEALASNDRGIWDSSQELIGEKFRRDNRKMTYAEMCDEHTAAELYRRAPFFRLLDVFWRDFDVESLASIKGALNDLIRFLDEHEPRSYGVKQRPIGMASRDVV